MPKITTNTETLRQIGWWYNGPETIPAEERFVDMATVEDEGPFRDPYAKYMVPVWIKESDA